MPSARSTGSRLRDRVLFGAALGLTVAVVAAACGSDLAHAPPLGEGLGGAGGTVFVGSAVVTTGPPPVDAPGFCGNEVHRVVSDQPNLVFVFDASGSMATPVDGSTRYDLVRDAAIALVRQLGPLINVGVARFPVLATLDDPCHAGELIMPVTPGDGVLADGTDGPVMQRFIQASSTQPNGGTPLAPTLRALIGPLAFVPGRTVLVLATDGGPNCNESLMCDGAHCDANIEGMCPTPNCCAPNGLSGPTGCIDATDANDAVGAFAAKGVPVFVVGVPGSAAYSDVLSQLAITGGSAQAQPPYYYKVDDLTTLGSVFGSIASLEISCDFTITDPPDAIGYTNVYLDGVVLPQGDGWQWTNGSTVELLGSACARLKSGQVRQVQIVSGCETIVR